MELYLLQSRKHIVTYQSSLRSKCFCLVSEQRKTKEQDFWFGHARNKTRAKKWKKGEGEAKHFIGQLWRHQMSVHKLRRDRPSGRFLNPSVCLLAFPFFLPHPLPAILLVPFFAWSLTLVPHSLLLNHTETLAVQAAIEEVCHSLTQCEHVFRS